jgi:hypothetical protein
MLNWIKGLFAGKHPPDRKLEPTGARRDTIRLMDDESYQSNADVIDGLQFIATLHIGTPLAVLQHHGEEFRGLTSQAPQYGSQADGLWIYKTKTFADLGLDVPEFPESEHATDIGPMTPSEYLPFLIEFRKIVESKDQQGDMLEKLNNLRRTSDTFSKIWTNLQSTYDDFPRSFFYFPFTEIPGVGRKTAKNLHDAGFRSVIEIVSAPTDRLTQVPGVGQGAAAKIKAFGNQRPGE